MNIQRANKNNAEFILLVEDEEDYRVIVKEYLEKAGFLVLEATSPEQACALLKTHKIYLVLADWRFGKPNLFKQGETGETVITAAREIDPLLPVIVMSNVSDVDVRSDALIKGAASFVEKGFSETMLVAHISHWLGRVEATRRQFNFPNGQILPLRVLRRDYVRYVVESCDGNISRAANEMKVNRQTVTSILADRPEEPESTSVSEVHVNLRKP